MIDYAGRDFDRSEKNVIYLIRSVICIVVFLVFKYLSK